MRPLLLLSSLTDGGAERLCVSFLARMRELGLSVPLCTLTKRRDGLPAAEAEAAGLRRLDLGAGRLADPRLMARYLSLLRRERIDLVHAHGQDATILAGLRRLCGGPRFIVTRHVLHEAATGWRARARAALEARLLRSADAVVAVSQAAAARLPSVRPERLHVLPNGIEVSRFGNPALAQRRSELRTELGLGEQDVALLCLAVLREGKGHELLFEAVGRLIQRGLPVRLLVAGDGELADEVAALARPLGDHVRLLGARTDVPELLEASDVVVLASEREALPTALIEAGAAGRAVVATRVGGTEEVVVPGETGLLVHSRDPEELAGALAALIEHPERRSELGAAGALRVRRLFSLEAQVARTRELWANGA